MSWYIEIDSDRNERQGKLSLNVDLLIGARRRKNQPGDSRRGLSQARQVELTLA